MLSFGRGRSLSTISIHKKYSDSLSVASRAARQTGSEALCLPKDLGDVLKSQHGNVPKNLPGDNASQEEVRYYLYSVLTCKDNVSAKLYPQWVLETCMSWEGTGQRLRNMSEEELQVLCPLRAGYAEINPSRKHKLEYLPLPVARQTIGAAIARAVCASRLAESRKMGMHQDWDGVIRRSSRLSEPTDDAWRQNNSFQVPAPQQVISEASLSNAAGPVSFQHNSGTRVFSPTLPGVHESQNESDYFHQNLAFRSRPTPLPRHMSEAQYAGSLDSASIESPVIDSILSQDSNSTSQTSLGGPETARDSCSSPVVGRRMSCASSITSTKQRAPRYEHKETLAELEASSVEVPPNQGLLRLGRRPRRYRTTSSICSSSETRNSSINARDSTQFSPTRRPSGLRAAIQNDEFGQYQITQPQQSITTNSDISAVLGYYQEPYLQTGSSERVSRRISYSSNPQGLPSQQPAFCNPRQLGDRPLNTSRSLPRLVPSMQSQASPIDNAGTASVHSERPNDQFFPQIPFWPEPPQSEQQEQARLNSGSIHGRRTSQIGGPFTLSPRSSHQNLRSFQPTHTTSLTGYPDRSDASVRSIPAFTSRGLGIAYPADPSQPAVPHRPTSVAPRAASSHKLDTLAFDQAEFHVWKGALPTSTSTSHPITTTTTLNERPQLAKLQSDNLVARAQEQQLRAAWNIDLHGRKGSTGPSLRYLHPATGQPRKTFYEAIQEREVMDGKPQRGVDRGLAQDWRPYH